MNWRNWLRVAITAPEYIEPISTRSQVEVDVIRRVTAKLKGGIPGFWLGLIGPNNEELNNPGYERQYLGDTLYSINDEKNREITFPILCTSVTILRCAIFHDGSRIKDISLMHGFPNHVRPGDSLTVSGLRIEDPME